MSECLIVKGSGETDLPIVHIVHSLEEARHAVLSLMYSNPADAEDTDELFAEFDDTMADDNYWTIAFEIGGISVERVCLSAAPTQGADGESLRPVAIYQIRHITASKAMRWSDVSAKRYDECILESDEWDRRIVYATRDATPADPNVINYPEAYREMQAAYFAAVDEIRALKSQQDAAIESQRSGDGS